VAKRLAVYVEVGAKRAFTSALDWPGWCRSGKGEDGALEALAAYAGRYAAVAEEAGVPFDADRFDVDVVERVEGSTTTDFGAPDQAAAADTGRWTKTEAERQASLVVASWTVFDRVVAGAPASLRKGPRGGGRDRDEIVEHVVLAEGSYARKLGVPPPRPKPGDRPSVEAHRRAVADALRAARDGVPMAPKGWLPAYAARRIAWHVLDHAWEIEDRT
jgi:hypothetical protein